MELQADAIVIKELCKEYKKGVKALDGLNLTIPKGKVFGFLGPNGAGKSPTINILSGLVKKDSGEVFIFGKGIGREDGGYKRDVGWVLEHQLFFDKLTAREYLEFVAAMYDIGKKEAEQRIDELLKFLDLKDKEKDYIETYSAGMKKKISLAAAIIHHPRLLILDEPLEAIDPVSAKVIKDNMKLMAERGATVFLSSHVLDTVEKLCDEVAIINKGKLVFQCETAEIKNKLKDKFGKETYETLEDVFIDVVSDRKNDIEKKKLSWL